MKTKITLVSVLVLLALLLSACSAGGLMPSSQSSQRLVTVNGVGQVTLQPDIAYIYVGVHTEDPSAADAVADNNRKTQALIDALSKSGVASEDIRTSNFSIWPSQQYDPSTGTVTGSIYMVDNTVYVTVRDLAKLGDLLDDAIAAGANTINSVTFDVADKTVALQDARKLAVEAAKAQAAELATAAGVSLGDVYSISYFDSTPYPVFEGKGMGGGGSAQDALAVPINPGTMQLSVSVQLAFEIR